MKRLILLSLLFLFLCACATTEKRQEPTIFMTHEARIQYYQEQITRYNVLIEQEQKKIEAERIIKRVAIVLIEHNLSIKVQKKIKVTQSIKLKAV